MNLKSELLFILIFILILLLIYINNNNNNNLNEDDLNKNNLNKNNLNKNRIIISFTTIPTRVKYLQKIFDNISKQTIKPDAIYACIPYTSKRLNLEYNIDQNLKLPPCGKIVRCLDMGPATKLLGCISEENDPNTIIITIDDDHLYVDNIIERMSKASIEYPDSVICNYALDENLNIVSHKILLPTTVKFLEGYGSVLYKRKFISEQMINYYKRNLSSECFLSDDLTISRWMDLQKIQIIKLPYLGDVCKIIKEIDKNNPLHQLERTFVYNKCMSEIFFKNI